MSHHHLNENNYARKLLSSFLVTKNKHTSNQTIKILLDVDFFLKDVHVDTLEDILTLYLKIEDPLELRKTNHHKDQLTIIISFIVLIELLLIRIVDISTLKSLLISDKSIIEQLAYSYDEIANKRKIVDTSIPNIFHQFVVLKETYTFDQYLFRNIISSLTLLNPNELMNDLLGELWQAILPKNYRKKIAAFYTKKKSAEFINNMVLDSSVEKILDLSCGSGILLIEAIKTRKKLAPNEDPSYLIRNIYGCDISPVSCLITTINLLLLINNNDNLTNIKINIKNNDAFKTIFPPIDLIIGNPPFSKGDRLDTQYKLWLENRIIETNGEIKDLINKKHLGLHGYFLLDMERHLKPNGRFALILPFSITYTESFQPILQHLLTKFTPEYLIKSSAETAFSNSVFEELIIIGTRKVDSDNNQKIKVVSLTKQLEDSSVNINALCNKIKRTNRIETSPEFRLNFFNSQLLYDERWNTFFKSNDFINIWTRIKKKTIPLTQVATTIRGNRVAPISIFGIPNKKWKIAETTSEIVKVQRKNDPEITFTFPRSMLYRTIKRYNELVNFPSIIPSNQLESYYIRSDYDQELFHQWLAMNESLIKTKVKNYYPPIARFSYLVIPQKISFNSTKILALYSKNKIHVGDGFMSISIDSKKSLFYYGYLNSSFGLFNLLAITRTITGGYCQILGPDMKLLRYPPFNKMTLDQQDKFIKHIQKYGIQNINEKKNLLDSVIEVKNNQTGTRWDIDNFLGKILGFNNRDILNLYDVVINNLKILEKGK